MSDKFIMGYSRGMGHPVEDALESFLIENTEWILSQDAVVEWCIVGKPWAEAVLFVTPSAVKTQWTDVEQHFQVRCGYFHGFHQSEKLVQISECLILQGA